MEANIRTGAELILGTSHTSVDLTDYQEPSPPQEVFDDSANIEINEERKAVSLNMESPLKEVSVYFDMRLISSRQRVKELNQKINY